jgi:predicted kinase
MATYKNQAKLILICGLPGSGKTTLAKKLTQETSAMRFCPDEYMAENGLDLHDETARERVENQLWEEAQELLAKGQNVILEYGFWGRSERDEKRLRARELCVAAELYYLDVSIDELWRRVQGRNKQAAHDIAQMERSQLEKWQAMIQAPDDIEQELFDTFKAYA